MAAIESPLKALGVPVISNGRSVSNSTNEYSVLTLERLLDRLESQLKEEQISKSTNSWKAAGIAIALTHAQTIVSELQTDQGLSANIAGLRSRLQRATQSYIHLYPLEQQQTSTGTTQLHFSGLRQTQAQLPTSFDTRSFLLQDDLMGDSDTDSEFEDNAMEEDLENSAREDDTIALGGIKSDERPRSGGEKENDVEDDLNEYEAATSLRRRKNAGDVTNSQEGENTSSIDEKGSSEDMPPTALQSERSVQDSLSGELLRMASILKTNSIKFADALERDRKILEQADEKLQGNLTLMTRTRGKLGDYSRKARGMGWITLGAIAMVCSSWVVMFLIIRLT